MTQATGDAQRDAGLDASVAAAAAPAPPERLTPYLLFLLAFLSLASFIDAFSTTFRFSATTYVRQDFGVSFAEMVRLMAWVNVGSCLAFVPRALADVWGRRPMLWITVCGMCALQWALAHTRGPAEYIAGLTLLALVYKCDVWMLVLTEEAPPRHRGLYTAVAHAVGATGAIVLGELIARMGDAPDAWRTVSAFPVWGLMLVVPAALLLRETAHYRRIRVAARSGPKMRTLLAPFRRTLLRPMLTLSILKMLFAGGALAAMGLIGAEYLRVVHGFGPDAVGRAIQGNVVAVMLVWICAGFASDRIGRHACVYLLGVIHVAALLALALAHKGSWMVAPAYIAQASTGVGIFGVLRIATMELLPNDCRAAGSAWIDLFMTIAGIGTTVALGWLTHEAGAGGGVPLWQCILGAAALVCVAIPIFALLPETRGRRLERV